MTSARLHRGLWVVGAAGAAALFAQTWARAARPGGIDLTTYLAAARALAEGASPYALDTPFPYLYPAFLAFVLVPLTWLPQGVVLVLWFAASIAALIWAVAAILRMERPDLGAGARTPLLAALFLVAFPVLQSNLRNGQVNFLVLALCVLALRHYRSSATAGGAPWAAAVATKIVPAVLGGFFARRRAWGVLAVGSATMAALAAAPALVGGPQILAEQRHAATSLVGGSFAAAAGIQPLDFSAGGLLMALGLPLPAQWLRIAGALLVVAIVTAVDVKAGRDRRRDVPMFALYLAAIPLVSPKSEMHHLAFVFPAAALVGARLWFGVTQRSASVQWLGVVALAAYALAIAYRPLAGTALCVSIATTATVLAMLSQEHHHCGRDGP